MDIVLALLSIDFGSEIFFELIFGSEVLKLKFRDFVALVLWGVILWSVFLVVFVS